MTRIVYIYKLLEYISCPGVQLFAKMGEKKKTAKKIRKYSKAYIKNTLCMRKAAFLIYRYSGIRYVYIGAIPHQATTVRWQLRGFLIDVV